MLFGYIMSSIIGNYELVDTLIEFNNNWSNYSYIVFIEISNGETNRELLSAKRIRQWCLFESIQGDSYDNKTISGNKNGEGW